MNYLVTGGLGFIGTNFISTNIEVNNNLKLYIIDSIDLKSLKKINILRINRLGFDLKTKSDKNIYTSTIYKNLFFINEDLQTIDFDQFLIDVNIDVVIHLAAIPGVRFSIDNPEISLSNNIISFQKILNFSFKRKISKFLYASSSSVYGQYNGIVNENDSTNNPYSFYAASKITNELQAKVFNNLYGYKTIGLRFFTVYGEYGREDMAPMIFANALYNNSEIKVFNYGKNFRDFTYVFDVIRGINEVLMNYSNFKNCDFINIGNSNTINTLDFLTSLSNELNYSPNIKFVENALGDVTNTGSDISKLKSKTNFKPSFNFKSGIKNFSKWLTEIYFK